jgi:hypothetical protein
MSSTKAGEHALIRAQNAAAASVDAWSALTAPSVESPEHAPTVIPHTTTAEATARRELRMVGSFLHGESIGSGSSWQLPGQGKRRAILAKTLKKRADRGSLDESA